MYDYTLKGVRTNIRGVVEMFMDKCNTIYLVDLMCEIFQSYWKRYIQIQINGPIFSI